MTPSATKPRDGGSGSGGAGRLDGADCASGSGSGSLGAAALARLSDDEVREGAAEAGRQMAAWAGRLVVLCAEFDRRQGWRAEGATSLQAWLGERCGVSAPTARALAHVGERLGRLPHLAGALVRGELSFDKVRTVVDTARPDNEAELCAEARRSSVRELAEMARSAAGPPSPADAALEHERRGLRFNDALRTLSAQLEADTYAEVRAGLEARAKDLSVGDDDGDQVRWDQRLADALVAVVRSGGELKGPSARRPSSSRAPRGPDASARATVEPEAPSPYLVVAHVALATLAEPDCALAGELEHHGWIGPDTVRRLACDAVVVVALDDDVGRTMYEGRARRDPTGAQRRELWRRDRHCRFPGCANAIFTHPHHMVPWQPDGRTDLDNLVLLCEHHHRRMHSREWSVRGDANEELTFVGPSGRLMTSRPSALWTRVTGPGGGGKSVAPKRTT